MTRERALPLLWINTAHEREVAGAQGIDVGRIERDVRVDPHQLVESFGERVAGHLAAPLVDRRIARDAPNGVAALLERIERASALRLNGMGDRNENDAFRVVHWKTPSNESEAIG